MGDLGRDLGGEPSWGLMLGGHEVMVRRNLSETGAWTSSMRVWSEWSVL
jgi:hypothetical protein